ncbi:MAG: ribbon-helix-helix domain-containing protein [Proteobacteria bacterium]|nr:ribbon-helix-helix domain-containing protein [Pseudomonadota bacterium]MBI3496837.1 ribbon-helix-helix domain-containing protein [Pseudomonadota bacterium]
MGSTLLSRNIVVSGHRTSMRLEPDMWRALADIAEREGRSLHELCTMVHRLRRRSSLTSAVRVFILSYYRTLARDLERRTGGDGALIADAEALRLLPRALGLPQLPSPV